MSSTKVTTARCNDYLYDPLFVVSGEKDYYKAAMMAKMSSAKFAVCPIFPSMFSDLPHHPRQQYVMRRTDPIPEYKEPTSGADFPECKMRSVDVTGVDRHKFFYFPVKKVEFNAVPIKIPTPSPTAQRKLPVKKRNKKIQTQYRESSAQTIPWQPADYIVIDGSDPELLKLDFLKWGSGLPAGMHEVRLIERARMKRAWEKVLPPITDAASLEKRRRLIEAMERDEWAFREQEIQDIQDLRLELLEQMLNELLEKSKSRTEQKMKMFCKTKLAEKNEKLKLLRRNTERELRKLEFKHRGVRTKYQKVNIVEEHADRTSELYGPLIRHGEHPKRWHQVIDDRIKKYRAQFLGVEEISTLPRWLDQATKVKEGLKLPGTRLCIRETKWTTPVLKQLHDELKNLRREDKRPCTLLEMIEKEESEIMTPEIDDGDDWEEELHQASVLIESVLRGRASQVLIFEGRDRCRELIQELRSTHALQEEDRIKKFKERLEVKSQQRENVICTKNASKLQETLNKLSGTIVGTLIDFLNKELRRLLEERRAHAMCLLFERERHKREAAEAGRRQKEMQRRQEHDEMFKQVVKVDQDTIDLYLQDIITEGMEFASEEEARLFIENLAQKIDDQAYEIENSSDFQEKQELIANLVHNFLLPEVEKQRIREKIKQRQHNYLKTVHEAIFNKVEDLPKPKRILTVPKTKKLKVFEEVKGEEEKEEEPSKPMLAEARQLDPAEILEHAIRIGGFDDLLDLFDAQDVNNMNLVYTSARQAHPSIASSIMQFQNVSVPDIRLPRIQVDVPSFAVDDTDLAALEESAAPTMRSAQKIGATKATPNDILILEQEVLEETVTDMAETTAAEITPTTETTQEKTA